METLELPIDFENKMKTLLKDSWEDFLECYTNGRYQALRLNPLKLELSDEEVVNHVLKNVGLCDKIGVPWEKAGFYYNEDVRPGKHIYHEMGLYYIQEPSAMSAAALADVKPGDRVLDLCAAPGGKTTQLAGYLQNEGVLVSNEIHPERSKILSQNVERLGIGNCIVCNEDPVDLSKFFPGFFDKIVVDAPCSGEGMFRKNPEAMNEWSLDQVQVCANRQLGILDEAAKMLAPGGRMVYSTCTFSPEEDEQCMEQFLSEHPDFSIAKVDAPFFSNGHPEWANGTAALKDTFRLWPHKLHGEGHYVAVLAKKDVVKTSSTIKNKSKGAGLKKEQMESLEEFCNNTLNNEQKIKY